MKQLIILLLLAGKTIAQDSTQIMLLNAYRFNFGPTSSPHYTGHLNLFMPSAEFANSKKWGINTGIMKINYAQEDSLLEERILVEKVMADPLGEMKPGASYFKKESSYRTEKKNSVWSFYLQPLYRITSAHFRNRIWIHGHLELFSSSWMAKTSIRLLNQVSDTIRTGESLKEFKTTLKETTVQTIHSLHGYFGSGVTLMLFPARHSSFFFQGTIGMTSNRPSPSSTDINAGGFGKQDKTWNSFYLVRAYYVHGLSASAQLVTGVDIRGLFPLYAPLYAAYAGLNLSLSSIGELVGK